MSGDPIGAANKVNKKKEPWLSNSRQIREEKRHCLLHGTMLPACKKQQRDQTLSKSREEKHKNPKKMSGGDNAYSKPRTSRFRAANVALPYAPPPKYFKKTLDSL